MDTDRYPIKWWHTPAAILAFLAAGLMPADPEPEPTDNQHWAETHYEREYAALQIHENEPLPSQGHRHE